MVEVQASASAKDKPTWRVCEVAMRIVNQLGEWPQRLAILLIFVMLVLMTADAVMTRFFSSPITNANEMIEELMALSVVTALPYTQLKRGQIGTPLLEGLIPPSGRRAIAIISHVLGTFLATVFAWRGVVLLITNIQNHSAKQGEVPIPMWPFALVWSLSFWLFALILLAMSINLIWGKSGREGK